jgi:N-acyl-D-aspartate/D-glutamate deacylase
MTLHRRAVSPVLVVLLGVVALAPRGRRAQGEQYDLVLAGGRVLDPETGLDATRNVGIRGGRIAAVTVEPLAARETLGVQGLVVAPGFIDLHVHGQDSESYRYYAHDGVTTALELEIGTYPIAPWYAEREGHALINYGASVGHVGARRALVLHDQSPPGIAALRDTSRSWTHSALPEPELPRLDSLVERGLAEGALGVGFGIAYTPGASREEILRLFRVAARHGVPCFVHLREGGRDPATGGGVAALQEVIADAAATGAALHVVHVTSMGQRDTPLLLQLIRGAREQGLDVTTEAYPYTAASTAIQSAVFDPGWQQHMGITYHDILYPPTGERLTSASFQRLRRQGAVVVFFIIPDSTVRQALADPLVMVASDGLSPHGHPRLAGTHARVLGRYVRDSGALSLQDAVRKMTLLPAQRLERAVAAMHAKGRVQVGADADLTVFDPARIVDRATYDRPAQFSEGIIHVLVNGVFVVRNGASVGTYPGRPIRRGP